MASRIDAAVSDTHSKPALRLEKIQAAAKRMCVSVPQAYRLLKSGELEGGIIKLGPRASAVLSDAVDKWISKRVAASKKGGAQ